MIDLNQANNALWKQVTHNQDIKYCYSCGTCVVGCPASEGDPPLLIRTLVRMVILGLEDELMEEDTPWACVTCSRCEEMCPMDVRPFELCLDIRKWQCRNDETRIPMSTTEVYKEGFTQPASKISDLRRSVGLTEEPPGITNVPEMLAQFQQMLMRIPIIQENAYMFEE